jgi:hypothetical protein
MQLSLNEISPGKMGQTTNDMNMFQFNNLTPTRHHETNQQQEEVVDDDVDPFNTQFNGIEVKSIKSNTHSRSPQNFN